MNNPVLYWMQAAQRTEWNPALSHAAEYAQAEGRPLEVVFVLTDAIPKATIRPYSFMMEGLAHTFKALEKKGITAVGLLSSPTHDNPGAVVALWAHAIGAQRVIADTGELSFQRQWRKTLCNKCETLQIDVELVDSSYLIPPSLASDKQEWSAATLRRKITNRMGIWLAEARQSQQRWEKCANFNMLPSNHIAIAKKLGLRLFNPNEFSSSPSLEVLLPSLDKNVGALTGVHYVEGGYRAGMQVFNHFINHGLENYNERNTDKNFSIQSNLSPWLHFGMISPAEILDRVLTHIEDTAPLLPDKSIQESLEQSHPSAGAFVEQLIVRRELAANLCHFNVFYDKWEGIPSWARTSLLKHATDTRPWIYNFNDLESGNTHDIYWNAAQQQLRKSGVIHNYMRMYWGKKILEWSKTPEEAFYTALTLNDKWALDGRDPNGYTGIAWCFGTHDRPWTERPIFGMIRYMNDKGLERKFNMKPYVERWITDSNES